ncbi:hypothetical protein SK128_019076 [Halocaridina rubra]|uniref:Uncharacterized protein n=1 Tax=Halocaridina rubra TaxID=373956 RepID=A0AAN8WZD7_HALRR
MKFVVLLALIGLASCRTVRVAYVDDDGDLERVVLQNTAPAVRQSASVSRPIVPARKTIVRGPVVQKFRTAPARPTVSFRPSRPVATFGRQNIQTIFVRDTIRALLPLATFYHVCVTLRHLCPQGGHPVELSLTLTTFKAKVPIPQDTYIKEPWTVLDIISRSTDPIHFLK